MRGPRSYSGDVGPPSPAAVCSGDWAVAAGAFLIQLTAGLSASSYGVLALHLLLDGLAAPWQAATTPLLYVFAATFTEAWCRPLRPRRWLAALGVAAAALGTIIAYLPCGDLFGIGILAGAGVAVASSQGWSWLQWHAGGASRLTWTALCAAAALCQFCAPLLLHALLGRLGHAGAQLLLAAVSLHAMVGVALLRRPGLPEARGRAYTLFGDVELADLSPSPVTAWNGDYFCGTGGSSPLLGARGWRNPATAFSDDELDGRLSPLSLSLPLQLPLGLPLAPPRSPVQNHRKMLPLGGVDILPRIPEESDEDGEAADEADGALKEAGIQRWTTLGAVNSTAANARSAEPRASALSRLRMRWPVLPLQLQLMRQRLCCCLDLDVRFRCYWWCGGLAQAFTRRLTYAAALQQVGSRLVGPLVWSLTPLLAREAVAGYSLQEAAFAAAVPAFGRLCALVASPCCARIAAPTAAYLAGVSGLLAAAGLYVLLGATTHDRLLLGAAIVGLGEGSHLACGAKFLDDADTSILQPAIDLLVGTFSLLLIPLLGHLSSLSSGISLCLVVVTLIQVASSLVWLLRPLVQSITSHFQQEHPGNTEWRQCTDLLSLS